MTPSDCLASMPNEELFVRVERLTARSNVALADLLAHLGEVERRGMHRERACASLYTYCIYELRMSEDSAFRRAKAARLVREYPELHAAVAKGEIHLTGVLMIGPLLGGERHSEILERARFRSKRELLRLVSELDPKPEVPSLVEPIGPARPGPATYSKVMASLAGFVRELPPGRRPEDWIEETTDDVPSAVERSVERGRREHVERSVERGRREHVERSVERGRREHVERSVERGRREHQDGVSEPSSAQASHGQSTLDTSPPRSMRYRVQFTASQEFVDLLDEAKDLIGYETPRPELPEIQVRALRALVKELRTRKRAALAREPEPAPQTEPEPSTEQTASTAARTAPARRPSTPEPAPAPLRDTECTASTSARTTPPPAARTAPARAPRTAPESPERGSHGAREANARARTRHVPAQVRRKVYDRDGARCAYRDTRAVRCTETFGLEIHHRRAFALGGPPTLDNLELRCRAHNTLAAELDFGRGHMDLRGANASHVSHELRLRARSRPYAGGPERSEQTV